MFVPDVKVLNGATKMWGLQEFSLHLLLTMRISLLTFNCKFNVFRHCLCKTCSFVPYSSYSATFRLSLNQNTRKMTDKVQWIRQAIRFRTCDTKYISINFVIWAALKIIGRVYLSSSIPTLFWSLNCRNFRDFINNVHHNRRRERERDWYVAQIHMFLINGKFYFIFL